MRSIGLVMLSSVLATGCAHPGDAGTKDNPAVMANTQGAPPASAGPLLVYSRAGGMVGGMRTLEVDSVGHLRLTDRRFPTPGESNLSADELNGLKAELQKVDGLLTGDSYPCRRCADQFRYELASSVSGTRKSVIWEDGGEAPEALFNAVAFTEKLILKHFPPGGGPPATAQ